MSSGLSTQNGLLLKKLLEFYNKDGNMEKILPIINGGEIDHVVKIGRLVAANYSKK